MASKETFIQKHYRQLIKSDFKPNEYILSGGIAPPLSGLYIRPKNYLQSQVGVRALEILWYSLVFLVSSFAYLITILGMVVIIRDSATLSDKETAMHTISTIAVNLISIYMALLSQSYVRWMLRNWSVKKQ